MDNVTFNSGQFRWVIKNSEKIRCNDCNGTGWKSEQTAGYDNNKNPDHCKTCNGFGYDLRMFGDDDQFLNR